jgi:hypothetical protein
MTSKEKVALLSGDTITSGGDPTVDTADPDFEPCSVLFPLTRMNVRIVRSSSCTPKRVAAVLLLSPCIIGCVVTDLIVLAFVPLLVLGLCLNGQLCGPQADIFRMTPRKAKANEESEGGGTQKAAETRT